MAIAGETQIEQELEYELVTEAFGPVTLGAMVRVTDGEPEILSEYALPPGS